MVDTATPSRPATGVELPGHTAIVSPRWDYRSWLIPVATFLGFAIPAASYLWMIHADGVNVVFGDQWDDVALIGHAYSGTLHFSTLWSQHYENRIFFPNLIVLALAYTSHFNVVTEEYLSALMLFGATALVICAHKRRSPERRWIWYCPVAFLLLSLAQAGNALWGFQMAWYLVLLMVALASVSPGPGATPNARLRWCYRRRNGRELLVSSGFARMAGRAPAPLPAAPAPSPRFCLDRLRRPDRRDLLSSTSTSTPCRRPVRIRRPC